LEHQGSYSDIKINNYEQLFSLINTLTYIADYNITADLVSLAVKKNYEEFSNLVFNNKDSYNIFNKTIRIDMQNLKTEGDLNIVNACLFVVQNLDVFQSKIKEKGYTINAGPQK
jgi:hypothetical protein